MSPLRRQMIGPSARDFKDFVSARDEEERLAMQWLCCAFDRLVRLAQRIAKHEGDTFRPMCRKSPFKNLQIAHDERTLFPPERF